MNETLGARQRVRLRIPSCNAETPPPLVCPHCAAMQATVRRDRQILSARLGYPADCVCCDCETGNACPRCLSENLEYGTYDWGTSRETGYADFGERYYCRDCGAAGDVDDAVAALVFACSLLMERLPFKTSEKRPRMAKIGSRSWLSGRWFPSGIPASREEAQVATGGGGRHGPGPE